MPRILAIIALAALSVTAHAQYNADTIRKSLTQAPEVFQIQSWKPTQKQNTHLANTNLQNTTIAVGPTRSFIAMVLSDASQALPAMIHCLSFGQITMAPLDSAQFERVKTTVSSAIQTQKKRTTQANKIEFSAEPVEAAGNAILTCAVSPAGE